MILISNDDGYLAEGIRNLYTELSSLNEDLIMFAPDRDCSGASHSITLARPLTVQQHDSNIYSVDGTPADSTHLALNGFFKEKPKLIVTGLNKGPNLGNDILYSGTVGSAYEGVPFGIPVFATSIASLDPKYYVDAAKIVKKIVAYYLGNPIPMSFLNINIPDLPYEEIKGFKITELGESSQVSSVIKSSNPRKYEQYWIGKTGAEIESKPGNDLHAINEGFVSITPLQFNLTDKSDNTQLSQWTKNI